MKKFYTTPSVKEIAMRCNGKFLEGSMIVSEEETEQTLSKEDNDFGW